MVIPTARSTGALEQLRKCFEREAVEAFPALLDVTSSRSISALSELIKRNFGTIEVLVNNAGINPDAISALGQNSPSTTHPRTFCRALKTNVVGTITVTKAMLPMLLMAKYARIVNVSSSIGSLEIQACNLSNGRGSIYPAYELSKAALNLWTIQLAHELQGTAIKVNAAHPG